MKAAVVVPGIMATRLILPAAATGDADEEVWPPTPLETQFGYRRIDKLRDHRLVPGRIVDQVLCFPFYRLLVSQLGELGYAADGAERRLVEFPYDWRRDLFDTADRLADRLDALAGDGAEDISLVAHSMGGLVARLVLESGAFDDRPFFPAVRRLVALAVPHLGAPLALARIFGVDGALGIRPEDFARLAADRDFPSGYQLIPAPGEAAVWNLASRDAAPLDVYDPAIAGPLGMDPHLVARAAAVHEVLGTYRQPEHVRYVFFGGTGHRTVTRVNVSLTAGAPADHRRTVVTRTPDAGDGTVPIWSALPRPAQRQLVVNEHATVFDGIPFKRVFFRLMGGDAGPPLEALPGAAEAGPHLALTIDGPVQRARRAIELTIAVVEPAAEFALADVPGRVGRIDGELVIDRLDEDGRRALPEAHARIPIRYDGPPVERLTLLLPAIDEPGLFRMRFHGTPPATGPVPLAVSEA